MKSTFVLALAAGASATLVARDTATILADISTISDSVSSLTTAVNGFEDINDAQPLIDAEGDLEDQIKQGTADAQATSGPISIDDTNSVLSAVAALIPTIVGALNAVVAKSDAFSGAGVNIIVANDLTALKSETDDFAAALVAIAPAEGQDSANAAVSCIDAAFVAAQATMSADAGCAAGVTTIDAGSEPTPTDGPTTTPTDGPTTTPTGTDTPTATVGPTNTPYPTSGPVGPTGYSTGIGGSYPTDLPWSNNGASVKVGLSGAAAVAALAMVL